VLDRHWNMVMTNRVIVMLVVTLRTVRPSGL
jgi:hypothetical protein